MPIDLAPNVASPFQLPNHKGDPDKPVFHLRALNSRTMLSIQGVENSGSTMFVLAAAACVGIENVTIEGEPLEVDPQPATRIEGVMIPAGSVPVSSMERLPPSWVALIGQEVNRRNLVTPDDLGK